MRIDSFTTLRTRKARGASLPSISDFAALGLVFGFLVLLIITIRQSSEPLAVLEHTTGSLDPWQLPFFACPHLAPHAVRAGLFIRVQPGLRHAGGKKPAGGGHPDPRARYPAIDPDSGLYFLHRAVFPGAVSGAGAGRGAGLCVRDIHRPGLEHDAELLPVAAHIARRPGGSFPRFPDDRLAEIRAPRTAFCPARPRLEHDDVDVRRLVFLSWRRRRSRLATWKSTCPASAPTWRWRSSSGACSPSAGRC